MENYQQISCCLCGQYNWAAHMEEREGEFWCAQCGALPPYSDQLYNAIVSLQRLFLAYFQKKAIACPSCGVRSLKLNSYNGSEPICHYCISENIELERAANCPHCHDDPCSCGKEADWCPRCEGEDRCRCGEDDYDEDEDDRHYTHYCGDPDCYGDCGVLRCGCIDVCRGRCGNWDY